MKSWIAHGLSIAVCLAMASGAAAGTSVFSSFGPSMSFNGGSWPIDGPDSVDTFQSVAAEFSPSRSGEVSSIEFAGLYFSGTNEVVVSLWTDSGGAPGTQLGSWNVTSLTTTAQIITLDVSGVTLTAGQDYFLQVGPPSDPSNDTEAGWNEDWNTSIGKISFDGAVAFNDVFPAFEIDESVPEPASWALAIGGLGLVGAMLRRRRMALA